MLLLGGMEAKSEIPILKTVYSNPMGKNHERQSLVGSFGGALSSQKVTEEFIRSAKRGWKSRTSCNGTRWLNCETDMSNRCESRT